MATKSKSHIYIQPKIPNVKWVVESLKNETYIVRPENCLGTCGWINGHAWQVQYIKGLHKACNVANSLNSKDDISC